MENQELEYKEKYNTDKLINVTKYGFIERKNYYFQPNFCISNFSDIWKQAVYLVLFLTKRNGSLRCDTLNLNTIH